MPTRPVSLSVSGGSTSSKVARARIGGVVLGVMIAIAGCDDDPVSFYRLGISADGDGPYVRYESCPDEVVESVYLADADDDQIIGDSDDKVLWHIADDEGLSMPVAIGDEPDGAAVIVHMTTQLQDDEEYAVFVRTSQGEALLSFTLHEFRDLRAGDVWAGGDTRGPMAEFLDRAAKTC
jgi:hypothetical protein